MSEAVAEPLSIDAFRAWVASRPDKEHWELIGGIAMMMAPAHKGHQRIASNLERLLNDAFEARQLPFSAYQRVGLNLAPVAPDYDPEPDVVVIDMNDQDDERYSDRFYLAAEVVSNSDRKTVISKRDIYKRHRDCRCVLVIEQDRPDIQVSTLTATGWIERRLLKLDDELVLEHFGLRCKLTDLYRGTALVPRKR